MKYSNSSILVVGGAGFIGLHVNKMLNAHGYNTVIFDDLSQGNRQAIKWGIFSEGSLNYKENIEKVFSENSIQAVMHFAALTDVGESVNDPAKYYTQNVVNTLNLLEVMRLHEVKTIVFSSSAAIFGIPHSPHIDETHACVPINPYGKSKLIIETILSDYDVAYGLKSSSLRYFNAAGGDPDGEIKNYKHKENNLIPIILRSLLNSKSSPVTIFGTDYPTADGTCIRDYIHVNDLASAHILAMEYLLKENHSSHYNLGNGNGFSVWEVINSVERVTGKKVNVIEGARRPGDPPILVADSQKAMRELGWYGKYTELDTMVAHAWKALL
ncbi:MAG: UDP-glucose 4-epimerase GalE [Parachlamydiaceae bacterium]|nr:UDP-glucose 4-epimerase GalE [Parachlamydiaceae bacterium]